MKQLFTILLALFSFSISLLPGMNTQELEKLPNLASHYASHLPEEQQDFGFIDFLLKHYVPNEHTRENHHHDLPFQCSHVALAFLAACPKEPLRLQPVFQPASAIIKTPDYCIAVPAGFCNDLFQPPRV